MPQRDLNVHITAGSMITAILFGILLALLWYLRDIVLILLTAVVIASAMEPGIRAFNRWGLARVLSVIVMYLIVLAAFFGIVIFFVPPVLNDMASFIARLPDTLRSVSSTVTGASSSLPVPDIASLVSSADFMRALGGSLGASTGGAVSALSLVFGGATSFILVVVLSFYFCVQQTGIEDFLRVISPVEYHAYVVNLWQRAQEKIGKWMQGQLLLALLVSVLLYLGLVILQVPFALLLAVLAAVCEIIPVFGQILATIPAVAVAFSAGGVPLALMVGGLFLVVQQFESHLIYPLVVKKVVGVPPLLVILALLIGAKLAGFVGILLSVPIAAIVRELVTDLELHRANARARAARRAEEAAQ